MDWTALIVRACVEDAGRKSGLMTEKQQESWRGQPASEMCARLVPDPQWHLTLEDLGPVAVKSAGFAWKQQRSYRRWNDLSVAVDGRAASDRVREIHGVIGEQLLLAVEAEIEKAIASPSWSDWTVSLSPSAQRLTPLSDDGPARYRPETRRSDHRVDQTRGQGLWWMGDSVRSEVTFAGKCRHAA
jgi:hypothetical protein